MPTRSYKPEQIVAVLRPIPGERRAPARTGGWCVRNTSVGSGPAARFWPSLGNTARPSGAAASRFLCCFLPNSPDRVVTRRRGSACNTLSAIRALPAIRRGKGTHSGARTRPLQDINSVTGAVHPGLAEGRLAVSDQDEFARILASLYQATLDDRHWRIGVDLRPD